jgi:predicted flap endonuclease-1-like 5' DNA nuclease
MSSIMSIEGVGESFAKKLKAAGISGVGSLLNTCASSAGRKTIAEKTGISHTLLLQWVNRADLSRIKGVGSQYADLLEASGVDSVPELAQRNAENLFGKIIEVNQAKKLVRQLPLQSQVANWIAQAKKLPKIVTH